jgi:hypothetical protein
LKPKLQEMAQNFENVLYKSVLELLFTPVNTRTPGIFLKNIIIVVPYCSFVLLSRKLVLARQNMARAIAAPISWLT